MTLKHNKKKNSLIVYEQLLTLAARLAANKKNDEFDFIVKVIKEAFSPKTALGREKKILQSITETTIIKDGDVEALINECVKEFSLVDQKRLELEKMSLINRVSKQIGAELFSIPIKEYRLYASAQIFLNENVNGFKNSSPLERLRLKKILKENIQEVEAKEEDFEMDNVTYNILVNKFNKKYGPFINENQKSILKAWTKSLLIEDKTEMKSVLTEKVDLIKKEVAKAINKKSEKSADYYELLIEAKQSLSQKRVDDDSLNEDFIYEVMRYCDLVEDLKDEK
jgi:hypothetical protein